MFKITSNFSTFFLVFVKGSYQIQFLSSRLKTFGHPSPIQSAFEIVIIFVAAFTSRCQTFLHREQARTELPLKFGVLITFRSSKKQELHVFDVLYSSIVTTIKSPAAWRFFNAIKSLPTTPHRSFLNFTISLPKTPAPKTTKGHFSLSCRKGRGLHFNLLKKSQY